MSHEPQDGPNRYICFCGVTVVGQTVCPDCSRALTDVLLRACAARNEVATDRGSDDVPMTTPISVAV
jgi:hypothetical protein